MQYYHMYCDIKSMDKIRSTGNLAFTLPQDTSTINSTLDYLMNFTSDLDGVQFQPSQVGNCNKVGFDPGGDWECIIWTYKWSNILRL